MTDAWELQMGIEDDRPFLWLAILAGNNGELTPEQAEDLGRKLIESARLLKRS